MGTGFRSQNRPARRRSRNLKLAIEPFFQFRKQGEGIPTYRREGIVKPATHMLGRDAGAVQNMTNPAYLQITPAFEADGTPLDIQQGDLFIRLKYLSGDDTTDEQAIAIACSTRAKFCLEVHTYEIRHNMFQILGDLS